MTIPDMPSDREMDLAAFGTSGESVEELLAGGADVDELIAAGVLDDQELTSPDDDEAAAIEAEPSTFTREAVLAEMAHEQTFIGSYGHGYRPISL